VSVVRPGDVIAGKFQVERVLGEGGMGYVVSARHLQLGQVVALKFMREEVSTPEYRTRFMREARNTVRLKSKHVSRVLDVGQLDDGAPYMVMELLEGTDLSALLHARGPFHVHEACEFVLQACEALAEAHGCGIVHRDLKPANLFLTRGPSGEPVVKVLDFGVSKVIELAMEQTAASSGVIPPTAFDMESVVTKATDLLGSPSYMAPEQIVSARDADARSDLWSLGVILFRLISGKAPFAAQALGELIQQIVHGPTPNLRDFRPDLPQGLEHIVARCLEKDRERRLGDVTELARLLAPYAGAVPTPSLERIAVLGPALVTTAARSPQASMPSVGGGSGAGQTGWANGGPSSLAPSALGVPRPSFPGGLAPPGGGSMPPGSMPPSSMPPSSMHPGSLHPASMPPGMMGSGYLPVVATGPVAPLSQRPRSEMSMGTATVLGVLFAVFVLTMVVLVVKIVPSSSAGPTTRSRPSATAVAPPGVLAPTPRAVTAPPVGLPATSPASAPLLPPLAPSVVAVPAAPPTSSAPGHPTTAPTALPTSTTSRQGGTRPRPKPSGDDIPATRD
jgi:serine/threonine-protein kinase